MHDITDWINHFVFPDNNECMQLDLEKEMITGINQGVETFDHPNSCTKLTSGQRGYSAVIQEKTNLLIFE